MSLAQGIQIEFLENGIIDNFAACTVSHKKDQISRTQDCTTIKLGETFLQPYKYLVVWKQTTWRQRPKQQLIRVEKQHGKLHIALQYSGKFNLGEATKAQKGE
jgi:hypothetical protein